MTLAEVSTGGCNGEFTDDDQLYYKRRILKAKGDGPRKRINQEPTTFGGLSWVANLSMRPCRTFNESPDVSLTCQQDLLFVEYWSSRRKL